MISVIVPVYKVEPYLDQCVSSIVNQTYKNLEIILVDDGSPDGCPAICDAWAARDERVRVIHKENGGLSDARNAGMAIATGEFIGFVDSDDHIAPNMYEELYRRLNESDSDISACGVEMFWEDGRRARLTAEGDVILDNSDAMEAIVTESWLKQPVWYKLYRRETVEGILFEKGKYHEDVFWSYQPVARAKRVCVFDAPLYFYRQREESIMGGGFSEKRLDALEAKEIRLTFLSRCYPELTDQAQNDIHCFARYLMQSAIRAGKAESKVKARMRSCAKRYPLKADNLKDSVWSVWAKAGFVGMCWLRNLLNIGE